MKIHIVGKDPKKILEMKEKISVAGYEYVEENPNLVISYGGDGMFLIAERIFPGVPKILVRDSKVGNKCSDLDILEILRLYLDKKYEVEEIHKLKAVHKGRFEFRELTGANDVVIRNSLPTEAIRFRYRVNGEKWSKVLIGDGLIISTAYGSSKGAYFYSVVHKSFEKGIGIAFNNITEGHPPRFLDSKDKIEIELLRGVGVLVSDNNRDFINLEKGDVIGVRQIEDIAKRIVITNGKH
jgi:NAD+ kinase